MELPVHNHPRRKKYPLASNCVACDFVQDYEEPIFVCEFTPPAKLTWDESMEKCESVLNWARIPESEVQLRVSRKVAM